MKTTAPKKHKQERQSCRRNMLRTLSIICATTAVALCFSIILPQQAQAGWFENARVYFLSKQYASAAPCFEKALQENPADHRALVYYAACFDRSGQTERARALYQLVISIFPGTASAKVAQKGLSGLPAPGAAAAPAPVAKSEPAAAPSSTAASKASENQSNAARASAKLAAAHSFHEQGKYSEAENNFADALHFAERGGQQSAQLVEVLQAEGEYFVDRRDYVKAYPFYKRELALRQTMYGHDSKSVMDCMMRIAPTYVKNGELDTADQMYHKWLPVLRKDYESAVNAHKRLTNERNALIGCMSGLIDVLRQTRQRHQSNVRDEYDDLSDELKLLQDEAAKPSQ